MVWATSRNDDVSASCAQSCRLIVKFNTIRPGNVPYTRTKSHPLQPVNTATGQVTGVLIQYIHSCNYRRRRVKTKRLESATFRFVVYFALTHF